MELFASRPAWYVIGPLIGLVVVGLMATINHRIGALGGYSNLVERLTGRAEGPDWRAAFLGGVIVGAFVLLVLRGADTVGEGYGWLTRTFSSDALVVAILFGAGILIGFGAKTAGGCTSGNGLGGCSTGSPASFAATATFMGTAIAASFVIKGLI
ncbi:MAG: uncharacterized protein QOI10_237 [Solirubrobacterales bacterium]|jgi:uncharacterized membrane protein YedE/YeeE|nr:uncharacterized protein [Solirubrobacterales bacterium]